MLFASLFLPPVDDLGGDYPLKLPDLTRQQVVIEYDNVGVEPFDPFGQLFGLALALQGRRVIDHARHGWQRGLLGGASTLASYGLALWAMTQAPIALVAALRETSVVFAAIMAALFLAEPVTRLRAVSIMTVAAGAVAIKIF